MSNTTDSQKESAPIDERQLLELVKLFEGFTQASSTFAQSYRALEQRIAKLSSQLEEQSRLLERTEGFLSSVLAHVPVGIVVLDMDGCISLFNEEAERLSGHRSEDAVGKPYGDVFPCEVTEPDSALYTLTNGTVIDPRERQLDVNGGTLPVRFSTSWIFGDDGQTIGVLEVFEDLTPLRDLQSRMQQSASLAALGEMAAQVAHELRNPLAGVQGFAQFLQEDLGEDHPAKNIADKIISGVRDIDHIASRLLEFTRPMSPQIAPVDLVALLGSEVDLARSEAQRSGKDIDVSLVLPEEHIKVACDGSLIKQAVLNLLKNSIHAVDSTGRIRILLRWDLLRNRVRIAVDDDGSGISEEHLPKIFNPFFTTRTKGTGLGLAMVKKIVDGHHGSITVKSTLGGGTTFTLELPITRSQ
ncbi:PAS domain S-box protein [bacterium]|nr:PAS domain S-box protein [bacterium]